MTSLSTSTSMSSSSAVAATPGQAPRRDTEVGDHFEPLSYGKMRLVGPRLLVLPPPPGRLLTFMARFSVTMASRRARERAAFAFRTIMLTLLRWADCWCMLLLLLGDGRPFIRTRRGRGECVHSVFERECQPLFPHNREIDTTRK